MLLARKFLNDVSLELNRVPPRLTPEVILSLSRDPWPGNVRELKSVMKRAALFAGEIITGADLENSMNVPHATSGASAGPLLTLDELKRQAVVQALAATSGKKMEAARLLDIEYRNFKRLLDRYTL